MQSAMTFDKFSNSWLGQHSDNVEVHANGSSELAGSSPQPIPFDIVYNAAANGCHDTLYGSLTGTFANVRQIGRCSSHH